MIERPSKRPRLSYPVEAGNLPGDLDVQEARARNDMRLKSVFERIFEKYGKDFSDIGDEIDLRSGKIVVDNGHLSGLQGEDGWLFEANEPASPNSPAHHSAPNSPVRGSDHNINGDARNLGSHETKPVTTTTTNMETQQTLDTFTGQKTSERDSAGAQDSYDSDDDNASVDSLLGAALSVQNGYEGNIESNPSSGTEKPPIAAETTFLPGRVIEPASDDRRHRAASVESIWRAPEVDGKFSTPAFTKAPRDPEPLISRTRSASPPGAESLWALPTPGRKRNTDVVKKSQKQVSPARRKKKRPSTITVSRDWSFAATNPDGSESDDPLQEDYQPSPTPKPAAIIRGRRCRGIPVAWNSTETTSGSSGTPVSASKVSRSVQNSTPTDSKRSRMPITPDEAKLIIRMKQVQKSSWKEIVDLLPGRTVATITQWNHHHWNERRANPPVLSKPWSEEERQKLDRFKDQSGLSWQAVRAELPGRSQAEIEFELLHLWVGDAAWENDGKNLIGESSSQLPAKGQEQKQDEATATPTADIGTAAQKMPSPRANGGDPSTPQKQKEQTNVDLLAEDGGDIQTVSGLSSIQIEARQNGSSTARRKRSPAKSLVSPLAKRSGSGYRRVKKLPPAMLSKPGCEKVG
ncbi:hypothetical protein VTN00DRAFT_5399 [Thermoascus crustaceus]|uniref:uncharacterized protein n=1 Tax=Thermoascus crustaceus TaxID=5088 RepID=UPI003742DEF2